MGATNKGMNHGAMSMGIGKVPRGGVVGAGGTFAGTVNTQDTDRKVTNSPMKVPSNVGIKQLNRTGGQGRKFAGKMAGEQATGTN